MLTCKEASYLASKKLDKKLTLKEWIGFLFHTAICGMCRHYAQDMKKLHILMKKAGQSGRTFFADTALLSAQSRERIKRVLDKAIHPTK